MSATSTRRRRPDGTASSKVPPLRISAEHRLLLEEFAAADGRSLAAVADDALSAGLLLYRVRLANPRLADQLVKLAATGLEIAVQAAQPAEPADVELPDLT